MRRKQINKNKEKRTTGKCTKLPPRNKGMVISPSQKKLVEIFTAERQNNGQNMII